MLTNNVSTTATAQNVAIPQDVDKKSFPLWKWIVSIAGPILISQLPETAGMTPTIITFLALTFWAVFCWATDLLPSTLVAVVLPVLYVIFKVATPADVFSPWASTATWTAFGGLIIAFILMSSGLAKRIAYWTILKAGVSFKGTLIGMMISGMIIAPFVPSVMGKIAIFVPIAMGICQALNLEAKSKAASAVLLAAFLAVASPANAFLTGNGGIPMVMGLMTKVTGESVSWVGYAYHNLPLLLIWSAISIAIVVFVLKPEKEMTAKEVVMEKYNELGAISAQEKKVCVMLVLTLASLITEPYHGINSAWVFIMLGALCFLPGVDLMNDEKLGKLNYKMLFFITGCMALGSAATASGAGKWLGDVLFPYVAGSPLYTTVAVWFLGVALNFMLTPLAAMASFTVPISEMCVKAGINPEPIIYSFLQGLDQYLLPYEFAVLLFVFSFGYISFKNMIKVMGIKMILNLVFIVAILYPYWKMIGLMN